MISKIFLVIMIVATWTMLLVLLSCTKSHKEENVPDGVVRVEKAEAEAEPTIRSSVCKNCGETLSCRDVEKAVKLPGLNGLKGAIVCVQHKGEFSCVYVEHGVCR
jgi:hypothetical protein